MGSKLWVCTVEGVEPAVMGDEKLLDGTSNLFGGWEKSATVLEAFSLIVGAGVGMFNYTD